MWQCALLALAAVGGDGQTVLLDFYSERCPPCRRMAPIVAALEEQGLPIRKVNVDQEPQLAQQYGVSGIPCFVMLAGGREIDRVVGATEPNRLAAMFASARAAAPRSPAMAPTAAQSPIAAPTNLVSLPSSRPTSAPPQGAGLALDARLIEASVRIRTEDAQGFSVGSGTIVDAREAEALVLTCGHLFRGLAPNAEVAVDLFVNGTVQSTTGRVLSSDEASDVALVVVKTPRRMPSVSIVTDVAETAVGAEAYAVGCDGGRDPSVWRTHVTAINKYEGPANIEAAREPVQGRSGGGLFTADGRLIGVCNAADPLDREGLYAALPVIHQHLTAANLAFLLDGGAPTAAPRVDDQIVPASVLAAAAAGRAEVICIVRPLDRPQAPSDVYVFDRPSKDFLTRLQDERTRHDSRALTSLQRPAPLDPAPRQPLPADGVIRGGWRDSGTLLR